MQRSEMQRNETLELEVEVEVQVKVQVELKTDDVCID